MKKRYLPFILLLTLLLNTEIYAQDSESDFTEVNQRKDWGFTISPYAWFAGNATDDGELETKINAYGPFVGFTFTL